MTSPQRCVRQATCSMAPLANPSRRHLSPLCITVQYRRAQRTLRTASCFTRISVRDSTDCTLRVKPPPWCRHGNLNDLHLSWIQPYYNLKRIALIVHFQMRNQAFCLWLINRFVRQVDCNTVIMLLLVSPMQLGKLIFVKLHWNTRSAVRDVLISKYISMFINWMFHSLV